MPFVKDRDARLSRRVGGPGSAGKSGSRGLCEVFTFLATFVLPLHFLLVSPGSSFVVPVFCLKVTFRRNFQFHLVYFALCLRNFTFNSRSSAFVSLGRTSYDFW